MNILSNKPNRMIQALLNPNNALSDSKEVHSASGDDYFTMDEIRAEFPVASNIEIKNEQRAEYVNTLRAAVDDYISLHRQIMTLGHAELLQEALDNIEEDLQALEQCLDKISNSEKAELPIHVEQLIESAEIQRLYEALEINGCIDEGGHVTKALAGTVPEFYTLYGRPKGEHELHAIYDFDPAMSEAMTIKLAQLIADSVQLHLSVCV